GPLTTSSWGTGPTPPVSPTRLASPADAGWSSMPSPRDRRGHEERARPPVRGLAHAHLPARALWAGVDRSWYRARRTPRIRRGRPGRTHARDGRGGRRQVRPDRATDLQDGHVRTQ